MRKIFKDDTGKYGKIVAGEKGRQLSMYGVILYVDHMGTVIFVDNEDFVFRFGADKITSFFEEEFKNGRNTI